MAARPASARANLFVKPGADDLASADEERRQGPLRHRHVLALAQHEHRRLVGRRRRLLVRERRDRPSGQRSHRRRQSARHLRAPPLRRRPRQSRLARNPQPHRG